MTIRIGILVAALLILSGCTEQTVDEARMECLSEASNAPTDMGVRQRVMLCHQNYPKVTYTKINPVDSGNQEKIAAVEDMHQVLESAARQANTQLANTRIDDYTTLKFVTYDRRVPVMTYHYNSSVLAVTGEQQISEAGRQAMYDYHRTKTCRTQFVPLMRGSGLQVAHRFEDATTGKMLISMAFSGSDCPM